MNRNESVLKYSPLSLESAKKEPGRELFSSASVGWTSLLVQTVQAPAQMEDFETAPTPDHLIVVVLQGTYEIESRSSRVSSRSHYHPGSSGMTAPMSTSRLRWSSLADESIRTLHLYVPQAYFDEVRSEYGIAGKARSFQFPDALGFRDPAVTAIGRSVLEGAAAGLPNLHAEAGARFLASHLIGLSDRRATPPSKNAPVLTDRRLLRVIEYIEQHFAKPVTVEELAREAAISPFHFSRLFHMQTGYSPARYVVRVRLKHASRLLKGTDLSITEIAVSVGYAHAGHFAAAFARQYGMTPNRYRGTIT